MTDSKAGNRTALHILGDGPVRFISNLKKTEIGTIVQQLRYRCFIDKTKLPFRHENIYICLS